MTELSTAESAELVLYELLGLRDRETVALVTDADSPVEMVDAMRQALIGSGHEYTVLEQPSRPAERKNDLNSGIAKALEAVDVLVALTGSGGAPIYATPVKRLLEAKTLRFMSMVMRDMDIFTRGGATADYKALYAEGQRLKALWRQGRTMRITSDAGTDITAPIAHDDVIVECGYATEPGTSAAFSDGEVSCRPLEGTASGVFVVDGPGAVIGQPNAPVALHVADGKVIRVEGDGAAAERLRAIVATVQNADTVAEFGIGLNPACRKNGQFEEEKKRHGQVHIAIGDNIFYGGTTSSIVHLDLVVTDPTVTLDNRTLVDRGRVLLDGPSGC